MLSAGLVYGEPEQSTPLQYSMVLSCIPDFGKSGMGMGMNPRSPANRGWGSGMIPGPRQIGDGTPIPDPRQIGEGDGDGDRGFRALIPTRTSAGLSNAASQRLGGPARPVLKVGSRAHGAPTTTAN